MKYSYTFPTHLSLVTTEYNYLFWAIISLKQQQRTAELWEKKVEELSNITRWSKMYYFLWKYGRSANQCNVRPPGWESPAGQGWKNPASYLLNVSWPPWNMHRNAFVCSPYFSVLAGHWWQWWQVRCGACAWGEVRVGREPVGRQVPPTSQPELWTTSQWLQPTVAGSGNRHRGQVTGAVEWWLSGQYKTLPA